MSSIKILRSDFESLIWGLLILSLIINLKSYGFVTKLMPTKGLQITEILFLVLLVVLAYKFSAREITFLRSPLLIPIGCYYLISVLSLFNSDNIPDGLLELMKISYMIGLFLIGFYVVRNEKKLIFTIDIWMLASISTTIIGLVALGLAYFFDVSLTQLVKHCTGFPYLGDVFRVKSTFWNYKVFTCYLCIAIPMTISLMSYSEKRNLRLFLGFLLVLFLVNAFFTFSRGWVGILVGMFLAFLKTDNNTTWNNPKLLLLNVIFLISLLCFGVFGLVSRWYCFGFNLQTSHINSPVVKEKIKRKHALHVFDHQGGANRVNIEYYCVDDPYYVIKKGSMRMIEEHPILGVGIGNFNNGMKKLIRSGYLPETLPAFDPHSVYFGKAAQTGFVGLISVIGLWLTFLIMCQRLSNKSADLKYRLLSWGFFSSGVGLLFIGIDMDLMNFRFIWVMFAIVASMWRLDSSNPARINRG
jgi:hypothetical protein